MRSHAADCVAKQRPLPTLRSKRYDYSQAF